MPGLKGETMRTLKQIKDEIETKQAVYNKLSSLNNGVTHGAIDTSQIGDEILVDMQEYNSRSKSDMYVGGAIVKRRRP